MSICFGYPLLIARSQANRIYDPGYTWLEIPYHLPVYSPGVCFIKPGNAKLATVFYFTTISENGTTYACKNTKIPTSAASAILWKNT